MIIGGSAAPSSSKKARKTYLRMVQNIHLTGYVPKMARINNPVIEFTKEDARRLHHPHNDALVVNICVGDYNTHRVLVDNGSSTDILYYPTFQQMRIEREQLIPTNAPLIGFGGTRSTITLLARASSANNSSVLSEWTGWARVWARVSMETCAKSRSGKEALT